MGEEIRSVRETTAVEIREKEIEKIEGLEKASIFIKHIDLNFNQIVTIEGLNKCKNLAILELDDNKILKIPEGGFDGLVNL